VVVDYIIPSSAVHVSSERIIYIGLYMPKLAQRDCIGVLF